MLAESHDEEDDDAEEEEEMADDIIQHDEEELMGLLAELKDETDNDDYIGILLKVEELIHVFITD